MTAPPDTGDGGDRPLSAAEQATLDYFQEQLATTPAAPEPSPQEQARLQAIGRWRQLVDNYRQLHQVFCAYREGGFTADQALRILAYTIAAGNRS